MSIEDNARNVLYSPEMIYLGLLHALCGKDSPIYDKPMISLSLLVTNIVQEKRTLCLDTQGVRISRSLYIPFTLMEPDTLSLLHDNVTKNKTYKISCACGMNTMSYEIITSSNVKVIGVTNTLCGVLLLMQNVYGEMTETAQTIFDIIMQSIMNKFRVDYPTVLRACTAYGYHPVEFKQFQCTSTHSPKQQRDSSAAHSRE